MTNSHNIRSAALTFHIPHAGILHGLAGYFEAVLYGDVGLSIHPDRKEHISKDMLSWFPLFFPLKVSKDTCTTPLCLSPPPPRSPVASKVELIGPVILAEQFRTSSFYMALN